MTPAGLTGLDREDVAFLRAACRAGVLVSWEVVVVLWAFLDRIEKGEPDHG